MKQEFSHRARKRFGQNFLHDENIIRRIVASVTPGPDTALVEIGPGKGALTEYLLEAHGRLTAVEVDRDLAAHLKDRFGQHPGFRLVTEDILKVDIASLAGEFPGMTIIGNLPYNISTPLIFHLLQQSRLIRQMVFMLQLEVVDRMSAGPGDADYGRLSVMVQYYCQVEKLFPVSPASFNPVPKVWSAVARLEPYDSLPCPAQDETLFARVVRDAFNQRRKTVRNSLKHLIDSERLEALGIDGNLRPETLALKDYVSISNALLADD